MCLPLASGTLLFSVCSRAKKKKEGEKKAPESGTDAKNLITLPSPRDRAVENVHHCQVYLAKTGKGGYCEKTIKSISVLLDCTTTLHIT